MIEARSLTKDYGTVVAVRDVSFDVGAGEVVGFLGPNGAGKSTTLRMLAGFLGATSGRVRIAGHDIVEDAIAARRAIGYMPEAAPIYPELKVREYLSFRAELKQVPRAKRRSAVARAMELAAVQDMEGVLVGNLSKGYRQRVALADALVASPPLLILDEPTAGLDPNQIRDVRRLIRELGEQHTILLSTHILPEVEAVCERALVIHRGQLVAQGTLAELRESRSAASASLSVRGLGSKKAAFARLAELLRAVSGVSKVLRADAVDSLQAAEDVLLVRVRLDGRVNPGETVERCVKILVENNYGVRGAALDRASLEDVFAQLTGKETRA